MTILLDTATFLWLSLGDRRLSASAVAAFRDPENKFVLSVVSAWEIGVKHARGRLPLPDIPERFVPETRALLGIDPLPLDEEAVLQLAKLPSLHKDPFDRILVCQAIALGLPILTPDRLIRQYPVRAIW
jgi:PIN domain nuclease of toxin-antitoxin system